MKLLSKILIVTSLLSLMACNNEPSVKSIDSLNKRLKQSEQQLTKLEDDFSFLVKEYARIDSVSKAANFRVEETRLLRAYLQQFEDESVIIRDEIKYTYSQLNDLRDDFEGGLYDNNTRLQYLASEEKAINVLELKIDYFSDRFNKQKKFVRKY